MRARELPELWIVTVDDESRSRVEGVHCSPPTLGDQLELAVTVQLVTEEIREADDAWSNARGDLGQRALVDLEQAELRITRGEERRRYAGHEIGSRAVVCESETRPQDLRGHRRCRRLTVGGRDQGGAERKPCRETVDRLGIELPEELAGNRRAASAPR